MRRVWAYLARTFLNHWEFSVKIYVPEPDKSNRLVSVPLYLCSPNPLRQAPCLREELIYDERSSIAGPCSSFLDAYAPRPPSPQAQIDERLFALANVLGGCERLLRTPIYTPYVRHLSRFLSLWCCALPLAMYPLVGPYGTASRRASPSLRRPALYSVRRNTREVIITRGV